MNKQVQISASIEDKMDSDQLLALLDRFIVVFRSSKPDDRSEKDRIYAMCITHLQEAAALFDRHVVRA